MEDLGEKVKRLYKLLAEDLEGPETTPGGSWCQYLDRNKVYEWSRNIIDILTSIDEHYYEKFKSTAEKISENWNSGDFYLRSSVKKSQDCLCQIIKCIEKES